MGRRARVSREQVLAAAREAFVERGYEGATLSAIGARLGVSAAALLRHAPTKEALFTAAMGATPGPELLPLAFLETIDPGSDPRRVLRQVAHAVIPFFQAKLRENLARWVHGKAFPGGARIPLPFDPDARPTAPQRNLGLLEAYFRRARREKRLRFRDARAAALAYFGTLHSYVLLQEVLGVVDRPLPLEAYLDTVLDVWMRGILPDRRTAR